MPLMTSYSNKIAAECLQTLQKMCLKDKKTVTKEGQG